jgi:tetratricopeptide (TPR) repeat protein
MPAAPPGRRPRAHPRENAARGPAAPWLAVNAPAGPGPGASRLLWMLTLAVVALATIVLLGVALGPHRIGDYMTETDFYGQYAEGARLVQHGRLEPARYGVVGPVYEVALALVGIVVRNLFLAASLLSVAAAAGTLLLWAALLRRRADAGLALGTVLFLATNATFVRYGYSVTTDALAVALQAATLYVLLARPGARAPLWAGLLAGIAFLTRYTAGVLLPAGLLMVAAGGLLPEADGTRARRGRAALRFALGFLAPVVPWVAWSYAHGTGVSFQLHHNIAYEVFARSRGIAWDTYQRTMQSQFHSLGDVIARDPGAVMGHVAGNVGRHLAADAGALLGWPVALCALLGVALAAADPRLRRLGPLVLAWALLFLALVPVFHSERYSLALAPFYAAAAAALFSAPRLALALRGGRGPWLKPLLALVPLALALGTATRAQQRVIAQLPVEVLPASGALRELARPGDRVIARKGHAAFYAGLEPVPFPFAGTLPELADYARERHARWLFFSWPEAETRPEFWYLLDTTAAVPGLTPRFVTAPHPAVLYEIGPEFGRAPDWAANDTLRALHALRGRALVNPEEWLRYGQLAGAAGRPGAAREGYQRAAELHPGDARVELALGYACMRAGDVPAAIAAFQRALELEPGNVDARISLGHALLAVGRSREAAEAWRPVVGLTRDSGTLRQMVGLYRALGEAETEARARAALAGAP